MPSKTETASADIHDGVAALNDATQICGMFGPDPEPNAIPV
jgi:hypothetical protein